MIIATTKIRGLKNRLKFKEYELTNKNISTFLETFNKLETDCKKNNSHIEVAVTLTENNKVLYKTNDFLLGNGNGLHVFEAIETELLELYPDSKKEISELITKLVLSASQQDSTVREDFKNRVQEKIKEEQREELQVEEIELDNKEEVTTTSNKRIRFSKKTAFVLLSAVTVLIIGVFAYKTITAVPSYDTLISEEKYAEAYKYYPEKKDTIEQMIFTSDSGALEKMEQYFNSTNSLSAKFDLSYLKQEYNEVVALKEEANTSVRKTALAVSYVRTGDIDSAYELNKKLNSAKLKQLISDSYEEEATISLKKLDTKRAEEIQAKIHTLTLQNKLDRVNAILNEEKEIRTQLSDSNISKEKKSDLEKQLKQTQEKIEQIKKGVF